MSRSKSIFSSLIFFGLTLTILRLPSFFFPWWYGDENIYLAIAHSLVNGQLLYVNAWDNKPPLIYLIYAGIYKFFQTQLYVYKFFNLLLGLWEICIFYYILKDVFLFSKQQIFWTTFSISVILGIAFEGASLNGENIFVPLVLSGFYLVYTELRNFESTGKINYYKVIISGIFWLLAGLTKIHAIVEIVILTFIVVVILIYNNSHKLSTVNNGRSLVRQIGYLKELWYFLLLPLFPIVLGYVGVILYYSLQGYLSELLYAIVGFGKDYVPTQNIPIILGFKLDKLTTGLQIRTFFLIINLLTSTYLFWKKHIQRNSFIIWCWLSAAVFTVLIPERDYGHYLLQLLPPGLIFVTSVVNHLFLNRKPITEKLLIIVSIGLGAQMLLVNFPTSLNSLWNGYDLVFKYFGNFVQLSLGKKSLMEWQKNFYYKNPLMYETQKLLPEKIKELTTPKDKIFLFAPLPEIYALSNRVNGSKWVVGYHIFTFNVDQKRLYEEILSNKTKLIVIDSNMESNKNFKNLVSSNYQNILSIQQYDFWIYKTDSSVYRRGV